MKMAIKQVMCTTCRRITNTGATQCPYCGAKGKFIPAPGK